MIFLSCILALLGAAQTVALGPHPPKTRPSGLPTYNPHGTNLNGSDFSSWVAKLAAKGTRTVALAKGQYNVQNPNADYASYITFTTLVGVTIWMDKVNLVFPDNTITAFSIDQCSNLTTYGPTIWWSTPGFGQATITSSSQIDSSTYQVQFQCDAGYDCSSMVQEDNLYAEYTNPQTGLLQPGPGWSVFSGSASTVTSNTWQFTYSGAYFTPLVGYKLLSRGSFLFCNKVTSSNSTAINDFTMLNCGGFGWFSTSSRRTMFNSFSLVPASFAPNGGTALPMRASSADGIHSASDIVGPQIDSSLFHLLDDDFIAVHGQLGYTFTSSGNTFEGNVQASAGDKLMFYAAGTYNPLGSANVLASTQASDGNVAITVDALPRGFLADSTVYTNRNQQGSGFSITNTHMSGNRGRGTIIKASNGLIADNVIEGVSYVGIYLGPEFSSWNESDYVHDITVRNNQIINCGYLNLAGSAFSLHGDASSVGSANNSLNPMTGNSNIAISNLLISSTGTPSNIYLGGATNVSLSGVVLQNALQTNYSIWEMTPTALANFQNVKFAGKIGMCQNHTGSRTRPDGSAVSDVHKYGTVLGGITTIPKC